MSNSESICEKCGKPKEKKGGGFVTQFIDICICDALPADDESRVELCEECGKRVERGRAGSFTQWIFRAEICSCKTPKIKRPSIDTRYLSSKSKTFELEQPILDEELPEEEIEVPAGAFPQERYKAKMLLGEGAAGTVYLCLDQHLGKKVAVKSLHRLTPEHLIAFQTEAKLMSKLSHPNIVKILDFGATDNGAPFMVMDFINGISLATVLEKQGPLDIDEAIKICVEISDALAHGHDQGVFHRDIKPSNVLIRNSDQGLEVKLIDFGVAKVKESTLKPTLIGDEKVVGTPAYMSPDQIKGSLYEARSEIYSLGCVLFELLSGAPPFVGETAMETLYMHSNDEPPPLPIEDERRPQIEALVHKALAKNKEERHANMQEFKDQLLSISEEEPPLSGEAELGPPDRKKQVILMAMSVALLLVAWFGYTFFQDWETRNAVLQGTAFYEGTGGIKQDYKKAHELWLLAAERGDAEAENNIGTLYMFGQGVPIDYKKALYWLRRGSAHGNMQAKSNLGIMYMNGQGVEKNDKKAFRLTKKAAEAGVALAENNLGYMYLKGRGVRVNYKKALYWINRGVEKGDAYAIYHKAYMYEKGLGLPKDKDKAISLYRKSADKNLDRAMVRLKRLRNEMPDFGNLIKTNTKKAE